MEDLKIVKGFNIFDLGRDIKLAENQFKFILEDISNIKTHYFALGYHLNLFNSSEYYKDFGFATMKDFITANTDLEYSMAVRCMQVNSKFCKTVKGNISRFVDKQYEAYNYSQLCEMCSMNENDLKSVCSDMTVKELRAIKKKNKIKTNSVQDDNCDVAIETQQNFNNIECVLLDDLDENNLEYFMADLLKILNRECNEVLTHTSFKGKQSFFSYGGKNYKLQLCEVKK